ncbi:hypothetical protein ES708_33888 [subsurface metagenome]
MRSENLSGIGFNQFTSGFVDFAYISCTAWITTNSRFDHRSVEVTFSPRSGELLKNGRCEQSKRLNRDVYGIVVPNSEKTQTNNHIGYVTNGSFDDNRPWIRALIYFSFCNIVTAVSGTLEQILNQPIFTTAQISNPFWIAYFSFCVIYVFIAYWILWSRMTLTFNRKYHLGFEIVFGVIWGFSTGGLLYLVI